jgi:iron complex outermembrane recepter protein
VSSFLLSVGGAVKGARSTIIASVPSSPGQFDVVRATFTDGTNVPRIPPVRVGGGLYWRNDAWFARVRLLHAFAQNDIAPVAETPTPGYDDLRAEVSYTWKPTKPRADQLSEMTFGVGTNLLNQDIRNSVSYTKDQVLLPGTNVRLFARLRAKSGIVR